MVQAASEEEESADSMTTSIPSELLERIWLYTNLNCDLGCTYCVTATPSGRVHARLELPVFKRLVDEAAALGFRQAALTGGEPYYTRILWR